MATDIIARGMAGESQNQLRQIENVLAGLPSGFTFKGTVPTFEDLPTSGVSVGYEYITEDSGNVYVVASDSPVTYQKLNMGFSLYYN